MALKSKRCIIVSDGKKKDERAITTMSRVHIVFKGQTADLDIDQLGITRDSATESIMERVAQHFDRATAEFADGYTVQWEENGNLTVRPDAEFGS